MSSSQEPLIIKDWDQGIAPSPHKGFGLFRNADIDSKPGSVMVAKQPGPMFPTIADQVFTANAGTDICTCAVHLEADSLNYGGAAVYFTTTDTLPAGLSENTIYFLIRKTDSTFQVATSYKNSVGSTADTNIDITDTGTGVHTIHQVPIGIIKHIVNDPRTGAKFMLSSNGRVWWSDDGIIAYLLHNSAIDTGIADVTNASGNGLAITPFSSTSKTFLFVFRNNAIDVLNVYGITKKEAVAWSNGWQTMNTAVGAANSHEALEGQDAAIYFCDDRYIGSIIEKVGQTFDPTNAATYTYNNQALDLPPYEVAQCLEELGTNLLVGGNTFNKIYPWDRISGSFNLPLSVPEYCIEKLKNVGGTVYILAGSSGNIYITQGSYVKTFQRLPDYVTNNNNTLSSNPITWGGIAETNGSIIIGVGVTTTGNSGVYRIWPDGRIVIDNIPSVGSTNVTALYANNDFYFMGYSEGADTFVSLKYGTRRYTSLETVIHSPLYKVATDVQKATYSHMEVVFSKEPSAGNIEISYRNGTSGTFTTIDTVSLVSLDSQIWSVEDIGLIDINNIQIQVRMNDSSFGTEDVELAEIRFIP